jgi:hypothetical protein
MKRTIAFLTVVAVVGLATAVQAATWDSFVIRNSTSGNNPPAINTPAPGYPTATEFVISQAGMKAAWGTNALNGLTLGDITHLSINRHDDTTRFTAGSGPAVAPYINMWITDGLGNFAVAANEPSNPEWAGAVKWNMTWDDLKTKTVKIFENSNTSWLPNGGVGLTFQSLANFTIEAPSAAQLTTGWAGLGSGAPREIGTNDAYGFNWVFGDTLSSYVSGDPGYVVSNPVAVPEPSTLALLALALGAFALVRRQK